MEHQSVEPLVNTAMETARQLNLAEHVTCVVGYD